MAKGKIPEPQPCCQKYGVPLYGASWVPLQKIQDQKSKEEEAEEEQEREEISPLSQSCYCVFAGGGGEGRSGIPNALLLSKFNFDSNSLSEQPVAKLVTGPDLPYRMAVHPGGDGVICSLPKSCRWFEWDVLKSVENHKLGLKSSEKRLTQLEDVGQQLALTFNREGSVIAVGGEDGHLRVFKWPTMEVILDQADAHATVKDLNFSSDGKFLVSLGSGGPCRVWDVTSSMIVASLPKENDEVFGFCGFSQARDNNQILYMTAMQGNGGSIVSWNPTSWKRVGSKRVVRDPICAFNVSADGKLLAIGTIQGDIFIITSSNMQVQTVVRKAHLGLVTALMFSQDSRALVSASLDSSARVTLIEDKKKQNGLSVRVVIFIVILAILAYFLNSKYSLPI